MGAFKVATHWCAIISLVTSLVIAVLAFKMPVGIALLAGTQGAAMGFMPIIYIIIAAVWLYNLTEKSGRSSDLKAVFNTIGRGDQRAQAAADVAAIWTAMGDDLRSKIAMITHDGQTVSMTLTNSRTLNWGVAKDNELKAKVAAVLISQRQARTYDVSSPVHPVTS